MTAPGFARHFDACNRHDPAAFAPLFIGGRVYGYVTRELAQLLPAETKTFIPLNDGIALDPRCETFDTRSAALAEATQFLSQRRNDKLRHEQYAVVKNWGDEPVAQIDRVAVPWFGVRAWGVHVNGYVRKPDGIHMWIGERAKDRPASPGKLDNIIGGGQPIGLTAEENLCKEAYEEAGVAKELAISAQLATTMNYTVDYKGGLRRDTLFIYDLELPASFTPVNTDGEVAAFHLMPVEEVAAIVRDTDRFKFNCNLVIIDFLMRHGYFLPGDDEYEKLRRWLAG
ncbi:MAG: DUF4743 domain-containing protein [Alphaproteobacteria bacterium]|nr:DUF4743 domain-containing protein [Alphaproteobacteria bacterium]